MKEYNCKLNGHCLHFVRSWEDNDYVYNEYICCFCGETEIEKVPQSYPKIYNKDDFKHGPYIQVDVRY